MNIKEDYGIDVENELILTLSEQLSKEIDKEILKSIYNLNKSSIRKIKIEKILKSFE